MENLISLNPMTSALQNESTSKTIAYLRKKTCVQVDSNVIEFDNDAPLRRNTNPN